MAANSPLGPRFARENAPDSGIIHSPAVASDRPATWRGHPPVAPAPSPAANRRYTSNERPRLAGGAAPPARLPGAPEKGGTQIRSGLACGGEPLHQRVYPGAESAEGRLDGGNILLVDAK